MSLVESAPFLCQHRCSCQADHMCSSLFIRKLPASPLQSFPESSDLRLCHHLFPHVLPDPLFQSLKYSQGITVIHSERVLEHPQKAQTLRMDTSIHLEEYIRAAGFICASTRFSLGQEQFSCVKSELMPSLSSYDLR